MHHSKPATPFEDHHMLPRDIVFFKLILVMLSPSNAKRRFMMLQGGAHRAEITPVGPLGAPGITTTKTLLSLCLIFPNANP